MGTRYRVLGCVLVAPLTAMAGLCSTAAAETVGGHAGLAGGYAYVCDDATQVQEMEEDPGKEVVVTEDVEVQNPASNMFEVFQASRPEQCAAMAAPFSGAVPGTLLVLVSWATPHLSIVSEGACRAIARTSSKRK